MGTRDSTLMPESTRAWGIRVGKDRMKDDFISTVTHELRTPLTSIRAFSEMLHQDPEIDLADRTRFLGIIVNEAERLTRLINQILDMAKLDEIAEMVRAQWPDKADDA